MINKEYGQFTYICDNCGAGTDEKFNTWQDAVDGKKDIGWKSEKTSTGWLDLCPDCQE